MCHATESVHQGCCCSGMPRQFMPRFMSKKQKIDKLETYLEGLMDEVRAVEEHIDEIKKEK